MRKSNGFTLIELLAVIIILAIIALIATPIIINIVEDARKEGFKQTALGYYKAAEYVYDEMFMDGKTGTIQFTFQNGQQISSNSNYHLETKGEVPQGGLIYLTKDGNIRVFIHNQKYCVKVNPNKEVTLSENIEDCTVKITEVPESCYSIMRRQLWDYTDLSNDLKLDVSEEWMTKEYNMLYYDKNNESCPQTFDTLIMPSQVNGQKVEGIGSPNSGGAFYEKSIKHLIIPEGIEVLDSSSFGHTGISHVELPHSLKYIGYNAFSGNNLVTLEIPNNVLAIGTDAFNSNQLVSVNMPNGVTIIGDRAFQDNLLTSVSIPTTVISIGRGAFYNNQLTEVMIPENVTTLGATAFRKNNIKKVVWNATNLTTKYTVKVKGPFEIQNVEEVEIGFNVTAIPNCLFYNQNIKSITIPSSVTSIGDNAFASNPFPNKSAITIEGDATRFDSNWTTIGFPAE